MKATANRSIKLNHPPDASAYGIESIPTPEKAKWMDLVTATKPKNPIMDE